MSDQDGRVGTKYNMHRKPREDSGELTQTAMGPIKHHKLPSGIVCPVALKIAPLTEAQVKRIKKPTANQRADKKPFGVKLHLEKCLPIPDTDADGNYLYVLPGGRRFAIAA